MGAARRFSYSTVAILLAVAASSRGAMADDNPKDLPDGTYEILICDGACTFDETGNAFIGGLVVMLPRPLGQADMERLDSGYSAVLERGPANACFRLNLLPGRKSRGYVSTRWPELTRWTYRDGHVEVSLARSPDSGYIATLTPSGSELAGTGSSWGAGVAEPKEPHVDHVVLRRSGLADIGQCHLPTDITLLPRPDPPYLTPELPYTKK